MFDHGGAKSAARDLNVPFLGEIPLNVGIRLQGDAGSPEKLFTETPDYVSDAINKVVMNAAGQVSIRSSLRTMTPTLTVE